MKITNDVLDVLDQAEVDGNNLVLVGTLDRKLYTKTNDVLTSLGGKWNRKAKAHIFDSDPRELIDNVLLTGTVEVPKDFDFFPTPLEVVDLLLDHADLEAGMSVLEPEAGEGAIVALALANGGRVVAVELVHKRVEKLQETFSDCRDLMILERDFMSIDPDHEDTPKFDRVIMNPPFSKRQDIHHVNHAMKFLKEDGILVAVMSSSVMFRQDKLTKEFRQMVEDHDGEFIELPEKSFKDSGTMVNTIVVVIPV